jgi:hypothetical protein
MHNFLLNILLFTKVLGFKNTSYLVCIVLIALTFFCFAAMDLFTDKVDVTTLSDLLLGYWLSQYAWQWFRAKRLELLVNLLVDSATETIVSLHDTIYKLTIENEALLKLLKKIDQHALRKSGIHLVINDPRDKKLPN